MDVWEYFQTREKEIRECSMYLREHTPMFAPDDASLVITAHFQEEA